MHVNVEAWKDKLISLHSFEILLYSNFQLKTCDQHKTDSSQHDLIRKSNMEEAQSIPFYTTQV